jgi:hypothetical protein
LEHGSVNFEGVSVTIAMPVHRELPAHTVMALCATVAACTRVGIPCRVVSPLGGSVVTIARNRCADIFLKTNDTHIFWIDSDMDWEPDNFFKVLAMATIKHVARASYPKRQDKLIFEADGLGFCCVQREVMAALAEKAPLVWFGENIPCKQIFDERIAKTQKAIDEGAEYEFVAEDTGFFAKVASLGYDCWLDPTIDIGHVGQKVYRGSMVVFMDELKAAAMLEEMNDGRACV